MKCYHVVGARPNFMKVGTVISALRDFPAICQKLIHTGQHYSMNMSKVFFDQLGLSEPDFNLEVGSASHTVQTATIMMRLEEYLKQEEPNLVLVYGDVNSTVAAALVCSKMNISIGHVEAGLRSFDRAMPEEVNRIITDRIADLLFTPSVDGNENLCREGISSEKIHFVGNVMIDTLIRLLPQAETIWKDVSETFHVKPRAFGLVTLHRPSNVDDPEALRWCVTAFQDMAERIPLIFPIHPRTRKKLQQLDLEDKIKDIILVEPIGYLEFLSLQKNATLVITDSGGIQEESTFLGVPCITLRNNTERPITVNEGTNYLVGHEWEKLFSVFDQVLSGKAKKGTIPPLWDGCTGKRIAQIIAQDFGIE